MEELKQTKLFAGCSDEALERLLKKPCRRQKYPAGRRMFDAGDPCRALMVLVEGQAEARIMGEEGREVLVDRLKAPMLLAPAFLFSAHNIIPVEVNAVTDCIVWHINREAFFEFMQQEPTVLRSFLEALSERGHFLSHKMRSFAVNGLKNRVIEYLETNGSISSVASAAQQLGATRPSLSRVLSDMLDEGVIRKDTKGYRKA
ncbi:MAG: Crp/Fnr family transcriptional regulator [Bacteroidales bacterium]|nr:Crp/Fnr family transcriptional regulator [Bacteroidales bacterium]